MSGTLSLKIEGMSCGHCVASVQHALGKLDAVEGAEVQVGGVTLHLRAGVDARSVAGDAVDAIKAAGFHAGAPVSRRAPLPVTSNDCCCSDSPDGVD